MTLGRKRGIGIVAALAVVICWVAASWISTAAFLLDVGGMTGGIRAWMPVRTHAVTTRDLTVPTRHGPVEARLFLPDGVPTARTAIVFPGIHGGGADEPRLARFSTRLAATGITVLTVPLPDLRVFRVTGRSTDMIEDATAWMTSAPDLTPTGRTMLVGISFAGGLALVAAGRPSLANRLDGVVTVGAHGDLARTLHYLCTGRLPDGTTRTPHDYGLAVIALGAVPKLVPAEQAAALEHGILTYLTASLDESPEQRQAKALLASASAERDALAEPAHTILREVIARDVTSLGRVLDPLVDDLARDPALSPERSPVTRAPVYAIHGHDDNVIPALETTMLAADLRARGNGRVYALVSPALSHVGLDADVSFADRWQLLRFWHRLID